MSTLDEVIAELREESRNTDHAPGVASWMGSLADKLEKISDSVYPRFLGMDAHGSYVWELANGRWTFAKSAFSATQMPLSFRPVRYIGRYGRPVGLDETVDRKAEDRMDPEELARQHGWISA